MLLQLLVGIFVLCVVYLSIVAFFKSRRPAKPDFVKVEPTLDPVEEAIATVKEPAPVIEPIGTFKTTAVPETVAAPKPARRKKQAPSTIDVSLVSRSGSANTETSTASFQSTSSDNTLMTGVILGAAVSQWESSTPSYEPTPTPSYDSSPSSSSYDSSSSYSDSSSSSSFDSGSSGGGDSGGGGGGF